MIISDKAAGIKPYTAGEQPQNKKYIKLNTNENPYPISPKAEYAFKNFDLETLKLYPDPESRLLKKAVARVEGVHHSQVFIGNGSDEVLAIAFRAFFNSSGEGIVFPEVSYSFYPVFCNLYDIPFKQVANNADFSLEVKAFKSAGGVVIANPNAPTSLALNRDEIEEIVKNNPDCAVIIDEAYVDFAPEGTSAVPLLQKYNNLAIVKTFSKSYSLAGIRCGYMLASKEMVEAAGKIKDSFNSYPLDRVCQAVCHEAILDRSYLKSSCLNVVRTRERVKAQLINMRRKVLDSATNFLFVEGGQYDYAFLKEKGILVRWFDKPLLKNYTRVTVGSDEEMDAYLAMLKTMI